MKGVSACWSRSVAASFRIVAAAVIGFGSVGAFGLSVPDVPLAPDMHRVVVSDHMVFNGVDMATYQVSSPHPLEEVLRFYREAWRGAVAESTTTIGLDSSEWTVLAHRENDFLVTLQLHPSNPEGVYGYIAISNVFSGVRHESGRDVLMPAGSKLVNDIVSDDLGRHSRTLVIQNDSSVNFNLDFYRQRLVDEGWTEVSDFSKLPEEMERPQALMLSRGNDELNIAVTNSGGTSTIVMVTVRK